MSLPMKVHKAFRARGLTAHADAVKAVASVLRREEVEDREGALDQIVEATQHALERRDGGGGAGGSAFLVDMDTVTTVIADLTRDDEDVAAEAIILFQTGAWKKHLYNSARKTFYTLPGEGKQAADAESKTEMYRERYAIVEQRVLRNKVFSPPVLGGSRSRDYLQLTPLESLLGTDGTKFVLAMLVRQEDDRFCFEDNSGRVPIDISEATTAAGLFTETSIVLAEGVFKDGVFYVSNMGFPPPEKRSESLLAMGMVDPQGIIRTPQELRKVKQMQDAAEDAMFVVLNDTHLDDPKVFAKLRALFEGFAEIVPAMFIFMGNLLSTPFGHSTDDRRTYQEGIERLADLIATFPSLCEGSRFLFVPGLDDPGGSVLPRPPIPHYFTKVMEEKIPRVTFATNPCRLRFYSQDIVLFRQDLVSKMRRHAIVPPSAAEGMDDITEHLVRTVIDQCHLCPLTPTVQPVYWARDHELRLYPLPNVTVLADSFAGYHWDYNGCTVFNPGPFNEDYAFVVYRPATQEFEFSRVED